MELDMEIEREEIVVAADAVRDEKRENLKQYIKDWVLCDNDICDLEKNLKQKKCEKKKISLQLTRIMSDNGIDCVDIQNGAQQILYLKKEVKKPLTKSKMNEILSKYFQGDVDQVDTLENYIFQNREVVWKENILRKNTTATATATATTATATATY